MAKTQAKSKTKTAAPAKKKRAAPKPDTPAIGHNSAALTDHTRRKLRGFVGELERIGAEMDELKSEAAEIYKAAKEQDFDVRALRSVIRERRVEPDVRHAREAVLDAYRHGLGMLAGTPLGRAAVKRERRRQAEQSHAPAYEAPPPEHLGDVFTGEAPDAEPATVEVTHPDTTGATVRTAA